MNAVYAQFPIIEGKSPDRVSKMYLPYPSDWIAQYNMLLMDGDTCNDCAHSERCKTIFGGNDNNKSCQFHPNKFVRKTPIQVAMTSPALQNQSTEKGRAAYPANFRGKVPLTVKLATNVRPDPCPIALNIPQDTVAKKDEEYYVWVNSYGAVSAILPNGRKLGLRPSEFDVIKWHETK